MEILWAMLGGIGLFTLVLSGGYLVKVVCREIKRMRRVADHYDEVAQKASMINFWGDQNYLKRLARDVEAMEGRTRRAERDASNALFRLRGHQEDYKHTKTAAKAKLDKERKEMERDTGCR